MYPMIMKKLTNQKDNANRKLTRCCLILMQFDIVSSIIGYVAIDLKAN